MESKKTLALDAILMYNNNVRKGHEMQNTYIIQKARDFAFAAHDGQERDGGAPYIEHPAMVATIVSQVTNDENVIAAAWLHDTLEDTDTTYETLVTEFNQDIADLVVEVSKVRDNPETKFPNLKTKRGVMLKFADRLSNISDMTDWTPEEQQRYIEKSRFW